VRSNGHRACRGDTFFSAFFALIGSVFAEVDEGPVAVPKTGPLRIVHKVMKATQRKSMAHLSARKGNRLLLSPFVTSNGRADPAASGHARRK
jgi:hypothetical protein